MIDIPKVTMTMRELDRLKCIQGLIDGHLKQPLGGLRYPEFCAWNTSGFDFMADGAATVVHYDWHEVMDLVPALLRQ
jgi:hypothetical protein